MPRLANRGTTDRAPQTASAFPSFPNIDAQLAEIDGGRTNAAFQRWNAQMRARLEGNAMQDNGRFRDIQTTITLQNGYLESVWTMQAIAGPVVTGMVLFSSIDPDSNTIVSRITFQADVFQVQTASGNHKQVFSTSADAIKLGDVLTVDLVNAKVFIGTGTYGNANTAFFVDDDGFFSLKSKLTFDPTGAGTLTVTGTIIAGAGLIGGWVIGSTYLVDAAGLVGMSSAVTGGDDIRFWAGTVTAGSAPFRVTEAGVITATSGTIGGWTLSTTTLSASNVIISNTGTIALGTTTDILILSAADPTYRIWAGDTVGATASFSVTRLGALFSDSGVIGGFTISATNLSATSGGDTITLSSLAGAYMLIEGTGSSIAQYAIEGVLVQNSSGNNAAILRSDVGSAVYGILELYNGVSGTPIITLNGSTGVITATSFAGSGVNLTALNASNLSSGTVGTARLGSGSASSSTFLRGDSTWAGITSGNVSGLAASATTNALDASNINAGTLNNARITLSNNATADVPITGYANLGGLKLATVT